MSLGSEFKAFIMRGNVVDLAVGVVIGAAFTKIVDAVVKDLFMPVVGVLTGGVDFTAYQLPLYGDARLGVGSVVQAVFNFLVIGWCMFLVVKGMNRLQLRKEAAEKPAELSTTEKLLTEIRDELRRRP